MSLLKTSMLKKTSIVTSHHVKKEAFGPFVHEQNNRISHCLTMTHFFDANVYAYNNILLNIFVE